MWANIKNTSDTLIRLRCVPTSTSNTACIPMNNSQTDGKGNSQVGHGGQPPQQRCKQSFGHSRHEHLRLHTAKRQ